MRKYLIPALALLLCPWLANAQAISASRATISPSTSAYSTGQCLGGVLTVNGMVRVGKTGGTMALALTVVDTSASDVSVDYVVLGAAPTGTYTDRATCTLATADLPNIMGVIYGTNFTWIKDGSGSNGVGAQITAFPFVSSIVVPQTTSLWFIPIIRASNTYASGTKLLHTFTVLPD
jgi:hypothetical protein